MTGNAAVFPLDMYVETIVLQQIREKLRWAHTVGKPNFC